MKFKSIEWSEENEPNGFISYNHVVGYTPFGRITVTWKGWKEYDSYCVDEVPWNEYMSVYGSNIKEVKEEIEKEYFKKLEEAICYDK